MQAWYINRGGQTFGPFPISDLRRQALDGSLRPDDLVAQEGTATWTPAKTVPGLFAPAAPPVAAAPKAGKAIRAAKAVPVTAPALAQPPSRRVLASVLSFLPKPLLFALCGGLGGLFGAVLVGELAWLILSPARLRAPEPRVRMAVPDALHVYAGDKNYFIAQVARDGFEGPITVTAVNPPPGVTVEPAEVLADSDKVSLDVAVAAAVAPGKYELKLRGAAPASSMALADLPQLDLIVEPMPATLRIAAPPKLLLYVGGKTRFLVRIGRSHCNAPVELAADRLPDGVTATPLTAPADANEAWLELAATEGTATGATELAVTARSQAPSGPLETAVPIQLEVRPVVAPKVDIFFVLDLTSSMQFAINGIKNGIRNFASQLEDSKLDARIGLVGFRDIEADRERPFVLEVNGEALTRDFATFRSEVGKLRARGGGDIPESSLQALAFAAEQPFRPDAERVLLLITDAPPKDHRREKVRTLDDALAVLKQHQIGQLHLVVHQDDLERYFGRFRPDLRGSYFNLKKASTTDAFASILPELGREISRITTASGVAVPVAGEPAPLPALTAEPLAAATNPGALKAVQSTETYSSADRWRLLFALAVWTIIIATAISLLILAGQALYARQGLPTWPEAGRGVVGGVLAGLVGGTLSQLVFQLVFGADAWPIVVRLGQVLGWTLLGGLLGLGISFFVPNLKWYRGTAGGVLGGVLGGATFVVLSALFGMLLPAWVGGILGRWLGAAIVGFCIGLMIALAELVFRRHWLEIAFSPREIRTVTLGASPVTVGGNERQVSVFVPDAAALALRFAVEDGQVWCEDTVARTRTAIPPGTERLLGKVRVKLCSTAQARTLGFRLHLSNGKTIQLTEGLPLTADDLPGLHPAGKDGIVALLATHPSNPGTLLLRNRSSQTWTSAAEAVPPGRSIAVTDGLRLSFGTVHGELRRSD